MRAMKDKSVMPRTLRRMTTSGKQEMMLRRAANHNVHMLTPHGRIVAWRKGRKD